MEQKEVYNDLSPARVKALRFQFKSNKGVYTFKLCNGSTIPTFAKDGASTGFKTFYANTMIPPKDTVFDTDGTIHVVAAIERMDKGEPTFFMIPVYSTSDGLFTFNEKSPKDSKIIDYLLASNLFKDNTERDTSVEPMYQLVDKVAKAQHSNKIRHDKGKAYQFADLMSDQDIQDFAAAMGWDENDNPITLRDAVGEMIDTNPTNFIKLYETPELAYRTILKRCIAGGHATFSASEYKISAGGTHILLNRVHGKNEYEQFQEYIMQSTKGEEIINTLKAMLYPKTVAPPRPPATPPRPPVVTPAKP